MRIPRHTCIVAALALFAAPAFAAQKHNPPPAKDAQPAASQPAPSTGVTGYGVKLGGFFNEQHKHAAKQFFAKYAKAKDCPEGLEKQGKACKAPVEGHYWAVGQPLQKAVTTYPLPDQLLAQLPPAPAGYEYVRAGEDVLLVSKGGMHLVVDVMENVV